MLAVDILCLLPNRRCSNSVMGSSTDIFLSFTSYVIPEQTLSLSLSP